MCVGSTPGVPLRGHGHCHRAEEDSGYPDYDTVQPTQLGGSATRSTGKEGDSLLGLLPSNISAFGGNNHLAGESSGTGPLAPAVRHFGPPNAAVHPTGMVQQIYKCCISCTSHR